MDQSSLTRLVQAMKGTSRFSDPKARVVVSEATTREMSQSGAFGEIGLVNGRGGTKLVSITDSSGNLFAMLDADGAADGATLS